MKLIKIEINNISLTAELYETQTANTILNNLPLEGKISKWGNEIYFYFKVIVELEENATDVLTPGELGYWPSGPAFCIFWGKTPASSENEARAASPVNIFGKIKKGMEYLPGVNSGEKITVTAI